MKPLKMFSRVFSSVLGASASFLWLSRGFRGFFQCILGYFSGVPRGTRRFRSVLGVLKRLQKRSMDLRNVTGGLRGVPEDFSGVATVVGVFQGISEVF